MPEQRIRHDARATPRLPSSQGSDVVLTPLRNQGIYFSRMTVILNPNEPDFAKTQWITSEDVNVEHLLEVFTTIDASSDGVWRACAYFMRHLHWHKRRLVILKPRIEGLPDNHSSKPECLFELSRLFEAVGDQGERKRLLTCTLKFERERGSGHRLARVLRHLADESGPDEGIPLAKEALEIAERLGDAMPQARCLAVLAWLLCKDKQFDAAEEAASRAIGLPEKGEECRVCKSRRTLGQIYRLKDETEKAIHQYEVALGVASFFDWHEEPFWIHCQLADLVLDESRFDDAHTHIEHAKSHAVNSAYKLGLAMELQGWVLYKQHRFEEARSEALRAADVYEKLGAAKDVEDCRKLLQCIQEELDTADVSDQSDSNCELL